MITTVGLCEGQGLAQERSFTLEAKIELNFVCKVVRICTLFAEHNPFVNLSACVCRVRSQPVCSSASAHVSRNNTSKIVWVFFFFFFFFFMSQTVYLCKKKKTMLTLAGRCLSDGCVSEAEQRRPRS